jgi:hypothetical protein
MGQGGAHSIAFPGYTMPGARRSLRLRCRRSQNVRTRLLANLVTPIGSIRATGLAAAVQFLLCGHRVPRSGGMKLDLNEDEALVFFEWLSRLDERDVLEYEDPAEREVLWILHGQLEKALAPASSVGAASDNGVSHSAEQL